MIFFRGCLARQTFFFTGLLLFLPGTRCSTCVQGKEYFSPHEELCLNCTICHFPYIVVAACQPYSNTQCGYPSFPIGFPSVVEHKEASNKQSSEDPLDKIFNKVGKKISRRRHYKNKQKKYRRKKILKVKSNQWNCSDIHFKIKNLKLCAEISKINRNTFDLFLTTTPRKHFSSTENALNIVDISSLNVFKESVLIRNETILAVNTEEDGSVQNISINIPIDYIIPGQEYEFINTVVGKAIIIALFASLNLTLVIILLAQIFRNCFKKKLKSYPSEASAKLLGKLPDPSQKPIHCRFTAVLPSKSTLECLPAELHLTHLLRSQISEQCNPMEMVPVQTSRIPLSEQIEELPSQHQENFESILPIPHAQDDSNSSDVHLYSRLPSPNPFTMDRLLEHRRTSGLTSVENNLYVDGWCSSPSPLPSRSSSINPSPALSCLRRTSPPLGVQQRSYSRQTPAMTTFLPSRPH